MAKKSIFREQENEGFIRRYYREVIVFASAVVIAVVGAVMLSEATSIFSTEPDRATHRSSTTPDRDWLIVTNNPSR
jgi:hypothetical protein